MSEGLPGRPKKYQEGYTHLSVLIPNSLSHSLDQFCSNFHLSKTDIVIMALAHCAISEQEREKNIIELKNEINELKKEKEEYLEKIASLKDRLSKAIPYKKEPKPISKEELERQKLVSEWLRNNQDQVNQIIQDNEDRLVAIDKLRSISQLRIANIDLRRMGTTNI